MYDLNAFNNAAPYVFIRNIDKRMRTINLSLQLTLNKTGIPFEKLGAFYIMPDRKLNELLAESEMRGIKRVDDNVYQIFEEKAEIYKVRAEPFETFSMRLLVKPYEEIKEGRYLKYDIIQTNEKFEPVGGEQYTIGNFGGQEGEDFDDPIVGGPIFDELPIDFDIFPNPTQGQVNIGFNSMQQNVSVEVTDMSGNIVYKQSVKQIDRLDFQIKGEKGLYFVKVITDDGTSEILKLIKN